MSTPDRFSDGQYKNWLKCSQSLIIMKEALHDYIDNEVKKLHRNITQKVSSIPCGSSTGNQCGCSWRNIKQTDFGKWFINCRICDKWLCKILDFHENPHNPNINWKNADIRNWPSDCYQVAKIFMPKGQDKTTKMPEDLDAPAVLSLLIYCSWFRRDLPNKHILYDLINIRNDFLHSGDLRVTNDDKDRYINKMIQVLKYLKTHVRPDVQAKLEKLKREDIDIKFRGTEHSILQNMVSCLQSEFTTKKKDVTLVQNLQSQLSQEVKSLRDNTTEPTRNMKILEDEIGRMRESISKFRNISDKLVSFCDKNPDIGDKKIIETIRIIGTDVNNHQQLRKETDEKLNGVKRKLEEQKGEGKQSKQLRRNQTKTASNKDLKRGKRKHEEQIENDEQLSLQKDMSEASKKKRPETDGLRQLKYMSEASKKKRPETDGLRQLKYQTEDKLDTLRRLKWIPTKQAQEAKKLLEGKRSVVIRGNPGEGKTTTALYLIDNAEYNKRVVLYSPQDWMKVDTEWVDIVVLEDIFGKYDLDSGRRQEWMVHLHSIQEHVDAKKLQVIITTRDDILSKAYSKLGSLKLFSDDLSVMLSSKELTDSEKLSILNRELQRNKKNMKKDEKAKCIANFSGLIGFPQCCLLFAGDSKLFDRGSDFFRSPRKFFVENITELAATRFLSLAFLFCNGTIWEENLSAETMPETSKDLLAELASNLRIVEKNTSITFLQDDYDSFLELYVVKSMSFDFSLGSYKPCIQFTHATVSEAVGQDLGSRCPKMVVKYGDSEYLYQRTYTAKAKDGNSQNMFIPESLYRLFAERMVHDVIEGRLIQSVVKHSALKQHNYLEKLKSELQKDNRIKDFFIASSYSFLSKSEKLLSGECNTFMQCILQCDKEVVRSVYRELLEFLKCIHTNNSSDCWQCEDKQTLLELSLYYNHFQIADELVDMNACYTYVSLCNAAKHGDLSKVQNILKALKRSQVFNPECKEAKNALISAYISGNENLIKFLLQEGIIMDTVQVVDVVQNRDICVLKKTVEHLKSHNRWDPHWESYSTHLNFIRLCQEFQKRDQHFDTCFRESVIKSVPYSAALVLSFCNEMFDIVDYLQKNEVNTLMCMLPALTEYSSQKAVVRLIEDLKVSEIWDPKCNSASEALESAYRLKKYDVCDILVPMGVSLTMENLSNIVNEASSESIKREIQNMKDTGNWDPKSHEVSKALAIAYDEDLDDVCDLLGVAPTMKTLSHMLNDNASFKSIKKAIQNMEDAGNWDPKAYKVSEALEIAYYEDRDDVCDLLIQEGVSPTMKGLSNVLSVASFESFKKAIQNMKDAGNWEPKSHKASKALERAYCEVSDDVCDLLIQEGVEPTMKTLSWMLNKASFESIEKAIQNMKDAGNWEPKCDDASEALETAYSGQMYNVCNRLVQEGISLTMKSLPSVVFFASLEPIEKAIQNLKDTDSWDPKSDDAFEALNHAYCFRRYDVCNLLFQEGVLLTMKNLPHLVDRACIKDTIQNFKCSDIWDPKSCCATELFEIANQYMKYDVCDLLIQEGVTLTMKNLPGIIGCHYITRQCFIPMGTVEKVINHLKDTGNWNAKCDDASEAIAKAFELRRYDIWDLLVQESISCQMKHLPSVVSSGSFENIKKVIQYMKTTDNWNPKCDDASKALENAYSEKKYDVRDLLVQNGILLTMKHLPSVVSSESFGYVKKAIQNLKDAHNWDLDGDDAFKALENAYKHERYNVCDLLVQEGIPLRMKNLSSVVSRASFKYIKRTIQHLINTENWKPKGDDASEALEMAYSEGKDDVCNLLIQKGISFTMKHLPSMVSSEPFKSIKKVIKKLKGTGSWNLDGDYASKALENAYSQEMYDVCHLLVQESISLTMKHLPSMVSSGSFESIKKVIKHLKDTDRWDPKCDDAFKALENSFTKKRYDVCDLLFQRGISLTMKNLSSVVSSASYKYIKRTIQHMTDSSSWDPECDDASKALENAYKHQKYDVCDLLIQEGVSFTTKNHPLPVYSINFDPIKIAIQNIIYIDHCIRCITCRVTQKTPVWNSKPPDMVVFGKTRFSGILAPRIF